MDNMHKEIARLNTEAVEAKRRLERLEENDKRHEDDIRQLYAHQEGTKVYVTQILSKLEALETKLFNALTGAQAGSKDERKGWQDLFKHVLTLTLGAIVAYLFMGGGGK